MKSRRDVDGFESLHSAIAVVSPLCHCRSLSSLPLPKSFHSAIAIVSPALPSPKSLLSAIAAVSPALPSPQSCRSAIAEVSLFISVIVEEFAAKATKANETMIQVLGEINALSIVPLMIAAQQKTVFPFFRGTKGSLLSTAKGQNLCWKRVAEVSYNVFLSAYQPIEPL